MIRTDIRTPNSILVREREREREVASSFRLSFLSCSFVRSFVRFLFYPKFRAHGRVRGVRGRGWKGGAIAYALRGNFPSQGESQGPLTSLSTVALLHLAAFSELAGDVMPCLGRSAENTKPRSWSEGGLSSAGPILPTACVGQSQITGLSRDDVNYHENEKGPPRAPHPKLSVGRAQELSQPCKRKFIIRIIRISLRPPAKLRHG